MLWIELHSSAKMPLHTTLGRYVSNDLGPAAGPDRARLQSILLFLQVQYTMMSYF